MSFTFDGFALDAGDYAIDRDGPLPYVTNPREYQTTPYGVRAGGVATFAPPAVRVTPLGVLIRQVEGSAAYVTARDALVRALLRPRRRLVTAIGNDRFSIATWRSGSQGRLGLLQRIEGEFIAEDAYEASVTPSADVRTPTLALLPDGSPAYGVRFSLTPGGSAPALPRILAVNQAAGVTPIAWRVTNLSTGIAVATSASVPAGSLLRLDKRGASVSSMASVLGYWPLADAATPFRDFSGNSRDLTAASSSPLLTNLEAFWRLEEASGSRADSVGSNTLTDNNTVTQATGKIGNAAQFTSPNNEYLSIADNPSLSMGNIDCTFAAWVWSDGYTGWDTILGKWASSGNLEYLLRKQSGGPFEFKVSSDGTPGAVSTVTASTFGTPGTATWYFVVAWHDAAANTINIQVNNGGVDSVAHSTGIFNGTSAFMLGRNEWESFYWNGRMDAVGVWKRVLSSGERTDLYNSGAGQELSGSGVSGVTYLADGPDAPPDGVAMDAAASFDGTSNGYADSSAAALGATGSLTLMGWVYLTSVSGTRMFASKSSTNNGFSLGLAGGVFRAQAGNNTTTRTVDGYTTAEVNRWYFVALTVTSTAVKLYVATLDLPPRLEDSDTGLVLTAGSNNFRLGAGHQVSDGTAYPTAGRLSEWMTVNAELTAAQIEAAWRDGPTAYNEAAADYEGVPVELVPRPLTTNVIELRAEHGATPPTPRVAHIWRPRWE